MAIRGYVLAVLVPIGIFAAIWWKQTLPLTADEQALFTRLDEAISHNPPRESDIITAFGPSTCHGGDCPPKAGQIGSLRYSVHNLRLQDEGLIFEVDGFSGACIRTDRIKSHFQTSGPENSCLDGVCWYTHSQRDWGILGFKLDSPDAACVTSAVINSTPEQRPKH